MKGNEMFSNEEKKKMVEQGIKQFHINREFRKCLEWFVDGMDKVYDKKIEQMFMSGRI